MCGLNPGKRVARSSSKLVYCWLTLALFVLSPKLYAVYSTCSPAVFKDTIESKMKKIIVTGATGFIGSNVVKQCTKNTEVAEVIVLTRKPIDEELSRNSKVNVMLHEEFSQYPDDLLEQLKGAVGCIWWVLCL